MEAGGPSQTARRVAAHRLEFTRVAVDYGNPGADEALAADVAAGRKAPANRMHDYLAARTAFFDRAVTGAIAAGVRQIVVGAAGYDGRALRYAKPGVRWLEIDHPATQRDKLDRIGRLGIDTSHVSFTAADFTADPVADRLRSAGLDPDEASLFLLEGVAVYLEPDVLERVLDQLREVAAPGQPAGHQRVPVPAGRGRGPGPVPGLGGRDGRVGPVHLCRRRSQGPAGQDRLARQCRRRHRAGPSGRPAHRRRGSPRRDGRPGAQAAVRAETETGQARGPGR